MSLVVFGEPITSLMAVGIVLVMGGVLLVELGSQVVQKHSVANDADAAR